MTIRRLLLPAALAAFLSLGTGGAVFTPPPAAAAFSSFGGNEEDVEDNSARNFLRAHAKGLITGLAVGMTVLFILFIGPADVWDAWTREGGSYNREIRRSTPGFGPDLFGSNFKL